MEDAVENNVVRAVQQATVHRHNAVADHAFTLTAHLHAVVHIVLWTTSRQVRVQLYIYCISQPLTVYHFVSAKADTSCMVKKLPQHEL